MMMKNTIAKLLAEEDIFVVHKQMETAYFDVKNRELGLPIWKENTITLHSNIKLSNNEGGEPIIEGEKIKLNKKDMWTYPVSNVNHGSDMVLGKEPRTMWVFGFSINQKTYQSIFN